MMAPPELLAECWLDYFLQQAQSHLSPQHFLPSLAATLQQLVVHLQSFWQQAAVLAGSAANAVKANADMMARVRMDFIGWDKVEPGLTGPQG